MLSFLKHSEHAENFSYEQKITMTFKCLTTKNKERKSRGFWSKICFFPSSTDGRQTAGAASANECTCPKCATETQTVGRRLTASAGTGPPGAQAHLLCRVPTSPPCLLMSSGSLHSLFQAGHCPCPQGAAPAVLGQRPQEPEPVPLGAGPCVPGSGGLKRRAGMLWVLVLIT